MKHLIRRLSRVADSSEYVLLRSESRAARDRRSGARMGKDRQSDGNGGQDRRGQGGRKVQEGHVPVYVGEEMERFVVCAEFLNHPVIGELLKRSAQEYGYEQEGVLRIPCHVAIFKRVLEGLELRGDVDEELLAISEAELL
ncbi:hypothetical protein AMTR_s00032p00076650 [Amborella trichopoda]|uniref:Uncharacterized protein n=2 Tax=Amborella trichopoda TaxID=13333 RepID=U5CXV2_AMBTC|nr:hypothetical protein AMTR_s00032p00076650 [Amborella trichopoda]